MSPGAPILIFCKKTEIRDRWMDEKELKNIDRTPQEDARHPKSRLKRLLIVLFILLLIGMGVFLYIRYQRTHITTDDAYVKGHIHWISPRIPGTVIRVLIDDNQLVKKGQLLVELDPQKYQIALSQARAQLEVARSKLKEAQINVQVGLSEIALNKAELLSASHDYERAKMAYPNKAISQQAYDHYLMKYQVAQAELLASKRRLKFIKDQVKTAHAQIRVCQDQIKAALFNLKYTKIKAPVEGYITKKSVEVGRRVGPQFPIFAIVPLDDLWIEANYKESQLQRIEPGQKVKIKIETYPDETLDGRVESIQAGSGAVFSLFPPENATGNWVKITQRVPVKIEIITRSKRTLRIGMSAETTILVK